MCIATAGIVLQKDMLHIVRTIFLWRGTAYQRIGVQNHGENTASFDLTLLFDNDFADLFEVRGEKRPRRGIGSSKLLGPTDVALEYNGLDGKARSTALHFDPRPTRLAVNAATWHLELAPQAITSLFVAVSCNKPATQKPAKFLRGLLAHRREMRKSTAGATSIETSNNIFNEVLCQSMADLNMLMTETPQGRYPYAGIPWYSTTFGRDGLITALQMLWIDPRVARGVLKRLAFYQAKTVDPLADAEPGKILHEMRGGEMAALREVPFAQYYGSVDATPLFVLLAGLYVERTGDDETLAELWPAIEAALALDRRAGRSRPGRLRRVSARLGTGPRQPGLEGFLRRHLPCRRPTGRRFYRAGGSAGLCIRRQTARGPLRPAVGKPRHRGQARDGSASNWPNVSNRRSGARNSAPMRWRSTATSSLARCAPRTPGNCCSPASCARTAPAWSPPT